MEALITIVFVVAILVAVLIFLLIEPKKLKCDYCDKELEQDEIVVYKGISCSECARKNKIIDSLDEIPGRFGLGG